MTTQALTLTDFLLARIAEDETAAREVARGDAWHIDSDWREDRTELVGGGKILAAFTDEDRMAPHHVERWNPDRVLAECEAKRRIVEAYADTEGAVTTYDVDDPNNPPAYWQEWGNRHALRLAVECLALPYADHEDFQEAWRV